MKKIAQLGATLSLLALVAGGALAGPGKGAPKCSKCHMALSAKKTKDNPIPVKIGGKTYYCCAKCGMPAAKPSGKM